MSHKKTIFSRQKSLEDTIQSYCWPIKDIFYGPEGSLALRLSLKRYLRKVIFFSTADKTFRVGVVGIMNVLNGIWQMTTLTSNTWMTKVWIAPRSPQIMFCYIQCPVSSPRPMLQILSLPRTNNLSTLVDPNWIISKAKLKLCHAATNNLANYALEFLWYCCPFC